MTDPAEILGKLRTHLNQLQSNFKGVKEGDRVKITTSPEAWNKIYKKRNDIDTAYESMYTLLVKGHRALTTVSDQVETCYEDIDGLKKQLESKHEEIDVLKKQLENKQVDQSITKADLKVTVKEYLPGVIRSTVEEVLKSKQIVNSYSDALKKTQEDISKKANKAFDSTLESALVRNQQQIIDCTKAKNDAEDYERKQRSRNIVITGIDESESDNNRDRIKHDIQLITDTCQIEEQDISKCFRAGKLNPERSRPRPLIVTLNTQDMAQKWHKYGFGRKITDQIWINQDLTRSERIAAFNARQARRKIRHTPNMSTNGARSSTIIDNSDVTSVLNE